MMQIGDKLPDIYLADDQGSQVSISEISQGKKLILYFYPKDSSPGCTNQAVAFEYKREFFEKYGYRIVGVSPDSPDSHTNFKNKFNLDFTLLSDKDRKLCELYNVWVSKRMFGKSYMGVERSTFVYDEEGKLIRIYRKVKPADHAADLLKEIERGKLPGYK